MGAGAFLAASPFMAGQAGAAEPTLAPQHLGGFSSGARSLISFKAIDTNSDDTVTVPEGYYTQAIIPWGDPIVPNGPAFKDDASNTAAEQFHQFGMGHDGIAYFPLRGGLGPSSRIGLRPDIACSRPIPTPTARRRSAPGTTVAMA